MKKPPMLFVTWVDSAGCRSLWNDDVSVKEFIKSGPSTITSVGFVIHPITKAEPWLTLSGDFIEETGTCGPMCTIPKVAILSSRTIK